MKGAQTAEAGQLVVGNDQVEIGSHRGEVGLLGLHPLPNEIESGIGQLMGDQFGIGLTVLDNQELNAFGHSYGTQSYIAIK